MTLRKLHIVESLCFLAAATAFLAAAPQDRAPGTVAEVQGEVISGAEVREAASEELEQLRLEALRFEAAQKQREYVVLESKLRAILAEKLLALEARAAGVSQEDLIRAEIMAKTEEPTEEEVVAFYEANQSRLQGNRVQLLPMIRQYLVEQKGLEAHDRYVEVLKEKYSAQVFLDPFRLTVETEGHPALGPATAPVTLVEFSDFQCPYCQGLFGTLKNLRENYGDRLRIVFRQFPLTSIHPHAQKAAEAALCAGDQEKFWEMHDLMFQDQGALEPAQLAEKAESLGLNPQSFSECLKTDKYAQRVRDDVTEGTSVGVTGTPAVFVNGRPLAGNVPYQEVARLIDDELGRRDVE